MIHYLDQHRKTLYAVPGGRLTEVRADHPERTAYRAVKDFNIEVKEFSNTFGYRLAVDGEQGWKPFARIAGHANPALVIFGNRPRRARSNPKRITTRIKLSNNVQVIGYVHAQDGECYLHAFGNATLNEQELEDGLLELDDLKTKTGVEAWLEPDGTITLCGTRGQRLAALFQTEGEL